MESPIKQPVSLIVREQKIRSAENILDFIESDQTDPAGRSRIRANNNTVYFEKATAANWASYDSALLMGSLGATCYVVASDAKTEVKNFAKLLQDLGYPVWVCDGVADNVEIQAAIDALTTGRTWIETVKLIGSFSISSTIIMPSYTRIDLTESKLTLANNSNVNMITNSDTTGGNTRLEIVGGILDGNKANQTSGIVILWTKVTFSKIINVEVTSGYTRNIDLNNSDDNEIIGVYSHDSSTGDGAQGLYLHAGSDRNQIIGGIYSANGDGIQVGNTAEDCYDNQIIDVQVKDNANYEGLEIFYGHRTKVIGGIFVGNTRNGIDVAQSNDVIIQSPYCRANGYNGILIELSSHRARIYSPQCISNTMGGMVIEGLDDATVIGGCAYLNQQHGLRIGTAVNRIRVIGFHAQDNDEANVDYYDGIILDGDANDCEILGCTVYNTRTQRFGIRIAGATGDNNRIIDCNVTSGGTVANLQDSGTSTIKRNNKGYVTENSGTATITAGQTSVDVTHGLATTPTRVILTPTTDTAGRRYWVSAKGATTFTITIDSTHTADLSWDWHAQIGEG